MTPSRLVATYSTMASHRLAHWMLISKPFAMTHLQRYLSVAPQLLLTDTPPTSSPQGIPTPTLVALDSACATMPTTGGTTTSNSSSSSSCSSSGSSGPSSPSTPRQLHTSSKSASAAAATAIYQQPHGQEFLIPEDLLSSTETYDEVAASTNTAAATAGITMTAPGVATGDRNAIAFNYLLAASWHPKSRQRTSQLLQDRQTEENAERARRWKQKLQAAHPHPGKVDAGEDAFFHVSTPSRVALGVADGVGGWSELGVDPALFSWALMNNAENIARLTDSAPVEADMESPQAKALATDLHREKKILDAQTILDGAYTELVQSGTVEAGSSTACILSLCKMTGTLRASNLGDSAFLVIRDKKCIYESPSQQHFWNCPYQLTVLPQKDRERQQRRVQESSDSDSSSGSSGVGSKAKSTRVTQPKKRYVQDLPKDAVQTSHQLQDGDVIVLATDGFWDNVFTKEAIELVDRELGDIVGSSQHHGGKPPPGEGGVVLQAEEVLARVRALSKRLTNTARRFSLDVKRNTPFSEGARHIPCGGKVDDITVIVTLTTAPPDPNFDELATIPGHVASFSADLASGQLLNVNGPIQQDQATVIQKLMQDVGQLVSRYSNGSSTGLLSATSATTAASADVEDSLVRKVTVLTEGSTLALTMADNKIYGIEKKE
ncbi:Protein phosphatase PTC7 [Mortierella alpina]|uniref:Protein phosphatase n=1 Tax=Mortierella alpina TaxID=64518 RepID=A0A9P6J773_MORAP|nr:Protein phosphatase PTC7 [Mortierella alpina]